MENTLYFRRDAVKCHWQWPVLEWQLVILVNIEGANGR